MWHKSFRTVIKCGISGLDLSIKKNIYFKINTLHTLSLDARPLAINRLSLRQIFERLCKSFVLKILNMQGIFTSY